MWLVTMWAVMTADTAERDADADRPKTLSLQDAFSTEDVPPPDEVLQKTNKHSKSTSRMILEAWNKVQSTSVATLEPPPKMVTPLTTSCSSPLPRMWLVTMWAVMTADTVESDADADRPKTLSLQDAFSTEDVPPPDEILQKSKKHSKSTSRMILEAWNNVQSASVATLEPRPKMVTPLTTSCSSPLPRMWLVTMWQLRVMRMRTGPKRCLCKTAS